ncbi:hypothetical protein ACFX14_027327 [Malus domestica]
MHFFLAALRSLRLPPAELDAGQIEWLECRFELQGRVAFHLFNFCNSPCYLWEFDCGGDEARVVTNGLLVEERESHCCRREEENAVG